MHIYYFVFVRRSKREFILAILLRNFKNLVWFLYPNLCACTPRCTLFTSHHVRFFTQQTFITEFLQKKVLKEQPSKSLLMLVCRMYFVDTVFLWAQSKNTQTKKILSLFSLPTLLTVFFVKNEIVINKKRNKRFANTDWRNLILMRTGQGCKVLFYIRDLIPENEHNALDSLYN